MSAVDDVCPLNGQMPLDQPALQHGDCEQEIVTLGSQISGKGWAGDIGAVEDTGLFLFPMNIGAEKLNPATQVGDERLQSHRGAGIVK